MGTLKKAGCHRTIRSANRIRQIVQKRGKKMLGLTREELDAMASVDIRTVDIDTLTDLRDIEIDTRKLASFAKQTKNLYVHRIGDYVVKVKFQKEGATIDDKMEEYLKRLAEVHI